MDDRCKTQIEACLAEEDYQNEIYEDRSSSNAEEDHLEEQEHLSESEQGEKLPAEASNSESEDVEPPQQNGRVNFYSGLSRQDVLPLQRVQEFKKMAANCLF